MAASIEENDREKFYDVMISACFNVCIKILEIPNLREKQNKLYHSQTCVRVTTGKEKSRDMIVTTTSCCSLYWKSRQILIQLQW